jgi:hypothetical protein
MPNIRNKNMNAVFAAAERDARAAVADNEEVASGSVRLDGSGSPRPDDDSVVEFHYVYTVMLPGCSGWSRPLT